MGADSTLSTRVQAAAISEHVPAAQGVPKKSSIQVLAQGSLTLVFKRELLFPKWHGHLYLLAKLLLAASAGLKYRS